MSHGRAILAERGGGPEVLELRHLPRPDPGGTQVLVRVRAAGINPVDWKGRARFAGGPPPLRFGFDVSGTVESVGMGVTLLAPGDEVFGVALFPSPGGAYADYLVVPTRQLAVKPAVLSHVEAAALPLASLTAWQSMVETGGLRAGQRVLIHAGAGGVGHLAVQIAKAVGAFVVTTVSTDKVEFVRSLGADEVIDYTAQDFTQVTGDIDVVLDPIGGDYVGRSLTTMRHGGTLVTLLPGQALPVEEAQDAGVRVTNILVEPDHAGMLAIAAMVERGELRARIAGTFCLEDAARAQEVARAGGTVGKYVIDVAGSAQ